MRSMFSNFSTEKLKLIKIDGSSIENIEALVEPDLIFVEDSSIIIEEGDIFERELSNGAMEYYEVLDRGFHKGMHGIPDHYQALVKKTTTKSYTNCITYNINNESGEIKINSTDNSVNVNINLREEDTALFETIKSMAEAMENKDEIIAAVNGMQKEVGTKSFLSKYNEFIQATANHIAVFAPFIPMLSKFLMN